MTKIPSITMDYLGSISSSCELPCEFPCVGVVSCIPGSLGFREELEDEEEDEDEEVEEERVGFAFINRNFNTSGVQIYLSPALTLPL